MQRSHLSVVGVIFKVFLVLREMPAQAWALSCEISTQSDVFLSSREIPCVGVPAPLTSATAGPWAAWRAGSPYCPLASLHYPLHPTHAGCWKGMRNTTKRGMEGGRPLMAHSVWTLDIWASFALPKQWGDSPTKLGGEHPHPSPQGCAGRDGPEGLWGPLNPDAKAYGTSRRRLEACSCWVKEKGIPSSLECPPEASPFPFGKDERNIIHLLCRTSLPSLSLFTRPSESGEQMVRGTHQPYQLQPQYPMHQMFFLQSGVWI